MRVQGRRVPIQDDPDLAAQLESDEVLLALSSGVLVDRFDARLLLDCFDLRRLTCDDTDELGGVWRDPDAPSEDEGDLDDSLAPLAGLHALLAAERWRELDESQGEAAESAAGDADGLARVGFAVPFDYAALYRSGAAASADAAASAASASDACACENALDSMGPGDVPYAPQCADLPGALALPRSERGFLVVEGAARFVARGSPQAAFVLRAKTAANVNFAFLAPSHALHPLFRWLVGAMRAGSYVGHRPAASAAPAAKPPVSLVAYGTADGAESASESSSSTSAPAVQHAPAALPASAPAERPPDEVAQVIAKFVQRLAVHGPGFEAAIRERESSNAKLSFLLPWDQNHAYYLSEKWRVLGASVAPAARSRSRSRSRERDASATCLPVTRPVSQATASPPTPASHPRRRSPGSDKR